MKNIFKPFLIFTLIFLISCEKTENISLEVDTNDDINYFIWRSLNVFYLWQEDVPDLADNRFAGFDDLYSYFRGFSSPESVFTSLLNTPEDRFSVIVDDYIALENSFQGLNLSNGMEFGLVRNKTNSSLIFGYVRYVVPNSDASSKNISRGQIFNSVNGQQLTENNFRSLLFGTNTNYTVEFADYNDGDPIANGNSISLTKTELQENPIAISKVIEEGNQKIGYLLYNQFARNYDGDLNNVFANFKSENINDLIIDLRYNPGGSTQSAMYLGSMVTGQFNGELYSKEIWNQKVQDANSPDLFLNNFSDKIRNTDANGNVILEQNINSLGLSRVYIITSPTTASASELVINSLNAYIDVNLVGTKTVGKQVGSITLYDSDNLRRTGDNFNQAHNYAIQPIVFEITNKDNENYPNGIIPGTNFTGIELAENFGNLGTLGEQSEPLLQRTIQYIVTGAKTNFTAKKSFLLDEIYGSKLATPASNNMKAELKNIILN